LVFLLELFKICHGIPPSVPAARMLGEKRSSRLFQNVQFHHGFERRGLSGVKIVASLEQTKGRGGADGETVSESGTRERGKTGKYNLRMKTFTHHERYAVRTGQFTNA
jgi:hypothetical protein